jgi:hypothetical protein
MKAASLILERRKGEVFSRLKVSTPIENRSKLFCVEKDFGLVQHSDGKLLQIQRLAKMTILTLALSSYQ